MDLSKVVRTGGNEFLVVLDNVTEQDLESIGHKIRNVKRDESQTGLPLQISMGWRYRAICAPNSTELETLIKEADDEMYRQKLSSSQSTRSVVVQTIMKMLEIRDFAMLVTEAADASGDVRS